MITIIIFTLFDYCINKLKEHRIITGVKIMTSKELLYIDDALSHEKYFQTKCNETVNQIQDPQLRKSVEEMTQRHQQIFQNFYSLLG